MRISILWSFWRVHKCRRHILGSLEPFAERRRRQGYPATAWEDAAALGFLVALITLLARRWAGSLDAEALASLQSELWECLTGLSPDTLGERIVSLSAAADPRFVEGSRRALVFETALAATGDAGPAWGDLGAMGDETALAGAACRDTLFDLWDQLLADPYVPEAHRCCQEFPDAR